MKRTPLLATDEYANLDLGIKNADEWFVRWEEFKKRGDSTLLLALLFYGLKVRDWDRFGRLDRRLVIHYLRIADGHQGGTNYLLTNKRI